MTYLACIYRRKDGIYEGNFPDVATGIIEGNTKEEVEANLLDALEETLDWLKEDHQDFPSSSQDVTEAFQQYQREEASRLTEEGYIKAFEVKDE